MEDIKTTVDEIIKEMTSDFAEIKQERVEISNMLQKCIDKIDAFLIPVRNMWKLPCFDLRSWLEEYFSDPTGYIEDMTQRVYEKILDRIDS